MKTKSALQKMQKLGTVISDGSEYPGRYQVEYRGYTLGILLNTARYGMESGVSIYTHRKGATRDSRSDYYPESWYPSFKQALLAIEKQYA